MLVVRLLDRSTKEKKARSYSCALFPYKQARTNLNVALKEKDEVYEDSGRTLVNMAVNNVSSAFDMNMYTTRLDTSKISEDRRKEAARIANEIEEERMRKERAGRSGKGRRFAGEYEDEGGELIRFCFRVEVSFLFCFSSSGFVAGAWS